MKNQSKFIKYRGTKYRLVDAAVYQPSKGTKDFTAQNLMSAFKELDEASASALADQSRVINSREGLDDFLKAANKLLDAHGVEAIRDEGAWCDYFGDAVALYINMGDPYIATLLYDVEDDEVYLTSYGDWMEAREQESKQ